MKLVCALAFSPMVAFSATVGSLPSSEYADTEVSTNIPIVVDFGRMNRLVLAVSLVPSVSNCVEVSIGVDHDQNGILSPDESVHTFGCDCGRWFRRDAVKDTETSEEGVSPCPATRVERKFVLMKKRIDPVWNLVRVTRRGSGTAGELADIRKSLVGLMLRVK